MIQSGGESDRAHASSQRRRRPLKYSIGLGAYLLAEVV